MDKRTKHKVVALSKLLHYMLTQRPDEFGLVPDGEGFVPLKEILQSLHEEEGWRYVRHSHIQEVLWYDKMNSFELLEGRVRAVPPPDTSMPITYPESHPPKLLYYGISRKSYPYVLQNGLRSMGKPGLHLSTTKDMAQRIARRKDPEPVILEVHAEKAWEKHTLFRMVNELIYLIDSLSPEYLSGPPLPKEREKPVQKKPERAPQPSGSFFLDLSRGPQGQVLAGTQKMAKTKKNKTTKMERKEARRLKRGF
jgi:putative RNA 2'-phosphotransferase